MPPNAPETLQSKDAVKTYRYLRIGMIGAVVLLTASILLEHSTVHCWQTSISAYYYTPVRAIFVGAMMIVGFALIVYRGRSTGEDLFLNLAGILAPLVAVAPTMDWGKCWSVPPNPLPTLADGVPAGWVVVNIDNNVGALLIAGGVGVGVAIAIALLTSLRVGSFRKEEVEPSTWLSMAITAGGLLFAWWALVNWRLFDTRAHGVAAVGMFVCLILAIVANVIGRWPPSTRAWSGAYLAIASLMVLGGVFIWLSRIFNDYTVFALEAYEISLFALYWLIQTVENWDERVVGLGATGD